MARFVLIFLLLIAFLQGSAQNQEPLKNWLGIWNGKLAIYTPEGKKQEIPMELHILPTDTAGRYSWKIIYDKSPRNYTLIAKDMTRGLYVIDENNGIILENQLFANTFFSCFEVMNNLLACSYSLEGKKLVFEIFSMNKKVAQTTGNLPEKEIPEVKAYPSQVMQRATLRRVSKQKALPEVKR